MFPGNMHFICPEPKSIIIMMIEILFVIDGCYFDACRHPPSHLCFTSSHFSSSSSSSSSLSLILKSLIMMNAYHHHAEANFSHQKIKSISCNPSLLLESKWAQCVQSPEAEVNRTANVKHFKPSNNSICSKC